MQLFKVTLENEHWYKKIYIIADGYEKAGRLARREHPSFEGESTIEVLEYDLTCAKVITI